MLDPESNLAEQLEEALKHHQRNVEATSDAKKRLAIMEQLAKQMEDDQSERG